MATSKFIYEGWNITTEYPMKYNDGGFHPVRLNEVFDNRYTVFRKLGYATRSTVWLAEDSQTGNYVALKIGMARYSSEKNMELTFKPTIQIHPGAQHVSTTIDSFTFNGPNGTHMCLVLEPLGRNFQEIVENVARAEYQKDGYVREKYDTINMSSRFCREVFRQLVLAIDYLHSNGIMHRDIHPGNILIALTYDINKRTKDEIQSDIWDDENEDDVDKNGDDGETDKDKLFKGRTNPALKEWSKKNYCRIVDNYINVLSRENDEPMTEHDPPYTIAPCTLEDELSLDPEPPTSGFCIKLIDLGYACKIEDCSSGWPYPTDIRAPEVITRQPYNEKADIWALACTMYRILTTQPLFSFWSHIDREETNSEHFLALIDRFGKLPDNIRSRWPQADEVLGKDRNDPTRAEWYEEASSSNGDIRQAVRLARPKDMSEAEAKVFADLLVKMLDWDPSKRLSTKEVLNHPWFQTKDFDA